MRLLKLAIRSHRAIEAAILLAAVALAPLGAFLLRFDFSIPTYYRPHLLLGVVCLVLGKSVTFVLFGLHRESWRYVSSNDLLRLAMANFAGSVLCGITIFILSPPGFPRSIYVLDYILCFGLTAWVRVAAQLALEIVRLRGARNGKTPALIYGAGDAGVMLAREIQQSRNLPFAFVGFVDDDPRKKGSLIHGVRVLGTGQDLSPLVARHAVGMVLIAMPSASGQQIATILKHCALARVKYKTMPPLGEIIDGGPIFSQVRDVAVEDLLGRSPVQLDTRSIEAAIADQTVLVTGAAGSIGSEMCRQIARFQPATLVGLDIGETPLFYLEMELRDKFPNLHFIPEIGDIQNQQRVEEVLALHRPQIVFHAAAYKHVPMMELHPFEAVENNVFGTRTLAACAAQFGVGAFVMISTDKAVRPTNIMGATKRLAELTINSLQNGGTRFLSVRFGNVLGSNGSVIPIFKKQIAEGGPVTVTHPEMQRYFMTIPEAAQLVLQASTLGRGGEIFVLDMGAPVKIADLARNLILLSGLQPDVDIAVEFTGIRPGEKLYEEIHLHEESILPTFHEKIKVFSSTPASYREIEIILRRLESACRSRNLGQLVLQLKESVPDYSPSSHILGRSLASQSSPSIHSLSVHSRDRLNSGNEPAASPI
ncbi:MAG: polysaccharide biosynthesis protein [Bryobacteraceae bacterium]|nr:polysaccharide biosynthesis protein [Bryobacteraceae bacterium]